MLRVGIIGMGYIGRTHCGALHHIPDTAVAAVADGRAQEIRKAYPDLRVFSTWHEMFRSCPLDAVIVAVPTSLYGECVVEAAKAGCDILCEKPFALDAASAERMLEVAERQHVILMVGQVLRFWPHYRRIKELVDAGALGIIRSITAYRLSKLPPWSSCLQTLKKVADVCSISRYTMSISFTGSWGTPSWFARAPSARRLGAGITCGRLWDMASGRSISRQAISCLHRGRFLQASVSRVQKAVLNIHSGFVAISRSAKRVNIVSSFTGPKALRLPSTFRRGTLSSTNFGIF